MKHGDLELDLFSNSVLDVLSSFCVLIIFLLVLICVCVCVLLYDLHNNCKLLHSWPDR